MLVKSEEERIKSLYLNYTYFHWKKSTAGGATASATDILSILGYFKLYIASKVKIIDFHFVITLITG